MSRLNYFIIGLTTLCAASCRTAMQTDQQPSADCISARYSAAPDDWGFRYLPVVVQDSVKGGRMMISRDWFSGHHILHIDGRQVGLEWEARLAAERSGKARMDFFIHVPRPAHGRKWSLTVTPVAEVDSRVTALQPVQVGPDSFDDHKSPYTQTSDDRYRILAVSVNPDRTTYHYTGLIDLPQFSRILRVYLDASLHRSGEVRTLPVKDTLDYRIASLTDYCDMRTRHLVEERDSIFEKMLKTRISFRQGSASIDRNHPENRKSLQMLKDETRKMLDDRTRILQDITLTAACSPEGTQALNNHLGAARANAVKKLLILENILPEQTLKVNSLSENWSGLYERFAAMNLNVNKDSVITELKQIADADDRERVLAASYPGVYQILYHTVYPTLREVQLNCSFRSATGKIKVVTSQVDEPYMQALQWMMQWQYSKAIEVLHPYQDYNTAICLLCLDRNYEAAEVLRKLPSSAQTAYLLAIAYYRTGDMDQAARKLELSFRLDRRLMLRVGHDPEVDDLIRRYDLKYKFS